MVSGNTCNWYPGGCPPWARGVRGEITSKDRGETPALIWGEANWHLDGHGANTKGKWGGVWECRPPKPCEGPCTSWGGEDQGPSYSPCWGGLEESPPTLGQRRFLPNWIPFCLRLPSAIMLLSLDTSCCIYQGAKMGLAKGHATPDKLSLTVA